MLSDTIVNKTRKNCNPPKIISDHSQEDPVDAAAWMRFLRDMKIAKMFSALPDKRQQGKTDYALASLMMWAFSACAFRQKSKNALHTSLENLNPAQRQGMLNLLEIEGDKLPHVSTVDNALAQISLEALSQIPLNLMKQLEKRKLFYNHPELLPNNALQIGCDGFWLHTYDHPHATNSDGTNACPYCLPRIRYKGTEKETTQWVHVTVTFVLICQGLVLPLYVYPLKAGQVDLEQPDDKLKEECELKATHAVLPMLREHFPRTEIIFLGDALYANRPTIRLCEHLKIDYAIVLKENNLKKLNAKCDELSKTDMYKTYYTNKVKEPFKAGTLERRASWFNQADAGEGVFTNVLRYEETMLRGDGSSEAGYKGSWICSKKLSKENCFKRARTGRMRWHHEDLHNTSKNRGYDMKHDMARTNPHLLFVWKIINFIAYCVFSLFQHTSAAKAARKTRSLMKFANDLLGQLINIAWSLLSRSPLLSKNKVQFRYDFDSS